MVWEPLLGKVHQDVFWDGCQHGPVACALQPFTDDEGKGLELAQSWPSPPPPPPHPIGASEA